MSCRLFGASSRPCHDVVACMSQRECMVTSRHGARTSHIFCISLPFAPIQLQIAFNLLHNAPYASRLYLYADISKNSIRTLIY